MQIESVFSIQFLVDELKSKSFVSIGMNVRRLSGFNESIERD